MAKPIKLLALVAIGPLLYAAGLSYAARCDAMSPLAASCFDAGQPGHFAVPRLIASGVMSCGAALLLCFTPWWLGTLAVAARLSKFKTGLAGKQATAHVWSLIGNTAMLILLCFLLRNTTGIGRGSFLVAWFAWTVVLAAAAKSGGRRSEVRGQTGLRPLTSDFLPLLLGIAAVAACLVLFHREIFLQCFNGDGTELDELARSLRLHLLPYWEIEPTGQFGTAVVNPLVTSSYWTLGFQLLLGNGELPTRLPYWIWWLGIFWAGLKMTRPLPDVGGRRSDVRPASDLRPPTSDLWPACGLALLLLLSAIWYAFYAGYDPYQGDIANPGVSDAMFTLWLLLSFDCLRQKDLAGWIASIVAASLLFYAGPVVFVLTVAAALYWQPVPRRAMLRASLICGGILAGLLVAYLAWGLWEGTISAWYASFDEEWLKKYIPRQAHGPLGRHFLGYFLLGCGGVPALGLIYLLWRGTPWQRTVATFILAYLAIILGCGLKNLHYLGPLLPLTVTLWLTESGKDGDRRSEVRGQQSDRPPTSDLRPPTSAVRYKALLTILGLSISIWLCWPPSCPTFTLNRELGKNTVFRTNDYAEACHWARIRTPLYQRGDLGWQISQHTWVGYATRNANDAMLPLCVTDGGSPGADYELVCLSPDGVKLYCRDPRFRRWMAEQRPVAGPERFPWILRAIAPTAKADE